MNTRSHSQALTINARQKRWFRFYRPRAHWRSVTVR
jgi:hypothetical protein